MYMTTRLTSAKLSLLCAISCYAEIKFLILLSVFFPVLLNCLLYTVLPYCVIHNNMADAAVVLDNI